MSLLDGGEYYSFNPIKLSSQWQGGYTVIAKKTGAKSGFLSSDLIVLKGYTRSKTQVSNGWPHV